MSEYIRVFKTTAEYEAYIKAEKAALFAQHVAEAKERVARRQQSKRRMTFTQGITRTFEELQDEVNRILSRQDVRDAQAYEANFHRKHPVKVFSGGIPSLGRR